MSWHRDVTAIQVADGIFQWRVCLSRAWGNEPFKVKIFCSKLGNFSYTMRRLYSGERNRAWCYYLGVYWENAKATKTTRDLTWHIFNRNSSHWLRKRRRQNVFIRDEQTRGFLVNKTCIEGLLWETIASLDTHDTQIARSRPAAVSFTRCGVASQSPRLFELLRRAQFIYVDFITTKNAVVRDCLASFTRPNQAHDNITINWDLTRKSSRTFLPNLTTVTHKIVWISANW